MAYAIPTRFHKVWSRHLREIERTKMCGRIIVKKKVRTKLSQLAGHYWQKYLSWRDIIGRSISVGGTLLAEVSQLARHYWQKYLSWRDIIGRSVIALNYLSWRDIIRRSIIRLVVSISEMFIRYTCIYVWNSQFQNNVIYHN
jgi:predicted acyl esterase